MCGMFGDLIVVFLHNFVYTLFLVKKLVFFGSLTH